MTDDLVKRLRQLGDKHGLMFVDYDTTIEAANRIEKLEAALRYYADHWQKQYHRDLDRVFWSFMNFDDGGKVARKALEGKND